MGSLTKADLVEAVYEKVGFSKKEAADVVEAMLESMKECLARHEAVKISGFGTFEVRHKRARRGRNPQTNEDIIIRERHVLTFRPSQILRDALNGDRPASGASTLGVGSESR
jgi:integration host factor subunit alpha